LLLNMCEARYARYFELYSKSAGFIFVSCVRASKNSKKNGEIFHSLKAN